MYTVYGPEYIALGLYLGWNYVSLWIFTTNIKVFNLSSIKLQC